MYLADVKAIPWRCRFFWSAHESSFTGFVCFTFEELILASSLRCCPSNWSLCGRICRWTSCWESWRRSSLYQAGGPASLILKLGEAGQEEAILLLVIVVDGDTSFRILKV